MQNIKTYEDGRTDMLNEVISYLKRNIYILKYCNESDMDLFINDLKNDLISKKY